MKLEDSSFLLPLPWTKFGIPEISLCMMQSSQIGPNKVIKQISSSLDLHLSAWKDASLPSLWLPHCPGRIKGNFNAAARDSFAVAVAMVSDSSGSVFWQPLLSWLVRTFDKS
jgi:hypothetical protein